MNAVRQVLLGLLSAVGSSLLVVAAMSLALAEGIRPVAVIPILTNTPSLTLAVTLAPAATTTTPAPGLTVEPTETRPFLLTATVEQPTICAVPANWQPYIVQYGDRLEDLAVQYGTTVEEIIQANCMDSASLVPGVVLYLPKLLATATVTVTLTVPPIVYQPTPAPCGPPLGWVRYTVQRGDTLYQISQSFGVSLYQLRRANCLSGSYIQAGAQLWVPNVPTRTPVPTRTSLPTATSTPEPTATETTPPPPPSWTPETPMVTDLPTDVPTEEVTPSPEVTEPVETQEPTEEPPTLEPTEEAVSTAYPAVTLEPASTP